MANRSPTDGPPRMKRYRRFNDLMRYRVRDVLLVSTLYDAYILQEDGHLTEKVYLEYRELQLSSAPRFSHADTAQTALDALDSRRFDLVLVVSRVRGMSVAEFARRVQDRHPGVAVVLLLFDSEEYESAKELRDEPAVDGVFAWSGDAKILLALSKYVEDSRNVDHDIEVADIRVILVVEDSIRFYSAYLAALYPELMKQSQSLFSEGLNRLQKLLRMRTRPKILLAQDYEQACVLAERYRDQLLALVSDVGFPRGGELDPQAGLRLVERVRREHPDLPILLQSADADYREVEGHFRVQFVNKNSTRLLHQIRSFLRDYLGFGPFIFRLPDGAEIRRAGDMQELATAIEEVPAASVEYHASRNHFSTWLMARSEYDLAAQMRPQGVADYASIEELRAATVAEIRNHTRELRSGVISDFSTSGYQEDSTLQRIGTGSLGGKARGIAFLDQILSMRPDLVRAERLRVRTPQSFVLATNAFDEFLQENELYFAASSSEQDGWIAQRFTAATLPEPILEALRAVVDHVHYPLAVRSSSLLEDDMLHPFAGIYGTVLLANQDPDPARRLAELAQAVKFLYASTYFRHAKRYLEGIERRFEEEKMAVLIQQVVGQPHGDRFYPFCSGVARSYNFYALPPQRPSEGAVQLAFGLGPVTAGPDAAVRFSPAQVHLQPQYRSPKERARFTQRSFRALDLRGRLVVDGARPARIIARHPLAAADTDGALDLAVSRYLPGTRALVAGDDGPGDRIVTFEGLIHRSELPLAETLRSLLALAASGIGMSVELEFALDLTVSESDGLRATLFPLQIRPVVRHNAVEERAAEPPPEEVLCRTPRALGYTPPGELSDVLLVRPGALAAGADPQRIASELGAVNARLQAEGRPYVLIGPGRWGEPERGGIPVRWEQIAGARVIVEVWPADAASPPVGAGFFDQVAVNDVGYLVLPPGAASRRQPEGPFLHWPFLEAQPAAHETAVIRHLRLDRPLLTRINDPQNGAVLWRSPR